MGKPKFSRKKYETPSHPWQEDRIKEENELVKKYGLKNKKEIWKAQTRLRKYRGQARDLLAKVQTGDAQAEKESNQLLTYLSKMNVLPLNSTLDDVLALNTESILARRLQTQVYLKGLTNTPFQARQLISHGHIAIGERRITIPGYLISKDEEGEIAYVKDSPLNDTMHPARPKADFKSIPLAKKVKEEHKVETEKQETKKEESKEEVKPKSTNNIQPKEKIEEQKENIEQPKEVEVKEENKGGE